MIRISLYGIMIVIMVGATLIVANRLFNPAESSNRTIANRFPEEREYIPIVEQKPRSWSPALPRMSTSEFIAAVAAIGRPRAPPRPPQPRDAVFNDTQIASLKNQLDLTEQQKPYWRAVEETMREVVWDRGHGVRPRVEPSSLERFKQAAAPLVATLNTKQLSTVEALANIVGVRLNRKAR